MTGNPLNGVQMNKIVHVNGWIVEDDRIEDDRIVEHEWIVEDEWIAEDGRIN
jgi:hypothetical protein